MKEHPVRYYSRHEYNPRFGYWLKYQSLMLWMALLFHYTLNGQEPSYIIKRLDFKSSLTSIQFSPDGSLLLAGFYDGSFRLLDPSSLAPVLEVENAHIKGVNAVCMPPEMGWILSAGHNTIKQWDLQGNRIDSWSAHATTIWNLEIGPAGMWAISSAFNKTFLLWDLESGEMADQLRGHEDMALAVTFSHDGKWIASGSNDKTVKIWDLDTRQVVRTYNGPTADVYDVTFSPDDRLLAVASKDHSVRIYDLKEEDLIHLLQKHRDMVMEVEFSPDGSYLITASADQSIMLWEVSSGERIHSYLDNSEAVLDLAFHPDGNSFYSISFAGDLTRWAVDPEILVKWHFGEEYSSLMENDPVFEPRREGESRKEFQARANAADEKRRRTIKEFYLRYLEEK